MTPHRQECLCYRECREQNTALRRRMLMQRAGVCWGFGSGDFDLAPRHEILGRGFPQVHGQRQPHPSAFGTPLGATLRVSSGPRDRMGLRRAACERPRHQRQWNVHRICRHAMGGRGLHGEDRAGPASQSRLLREARRAGARHGRCGGSFRIRQSEALSGSSRVTLQQQSGLRPIYTSGS